MLNKPYFHDLRNYLVTHVISGKEESGAFFGYMSRKRLRNLFRKSVVFTIKIVTLQTKLKEANYKP